MSTLTRTRTEVRGAHAGLTGSLISAGIGSFFGLAGFLAVVAGDDTIALDIASISAALLAVVGLVATLFVRAYPGYAAIAMALAPTGYALAFGDNWSTWTAAYQAAIASSGAVETTFWAAMPAMALFAISGVLLALGAILAVLDTLAHGDTRKEPPR